MTKKIDLRRQTIGVEIEMTGITRTRVAEILAAHLGGTIQTEPGGGAFVTDTRGRRWDAKGDSSIRAHYREADGREMQPFETACVEMRNWQVELATPILDYSDIELLQELVRKLFEAGARSSAELGCGIHIHIGADNHDARSLRNIINIMSSRQALLYEALKVDDAREKGYAAKTNPYLVEAINHIKPKKINEFETIMDEEGPAKTTRYSGINLQAIWLIGTVEWRLFNGTLHAGEIKTYIQLALAISAQAINQRSASPTAPITYNPAYTFRTWLLRLGMIGDEFKTARHHLLKNLPGDKAWRLAS